MLLYTQEFFLEWKFLLWLLNARIDLFDILDLPTA
jgi:hypothetical protein